MEVVKGAQLYLQEAGSYMCQVVIEDNNELLRHFLVVGADPFALDYDRRTTLHIAVVEGNFGVTKMLLDVGTNSRAQDK